MRACENCDHPPHGGDPCGVPRERRGFGQTAETVPCWCASYTETPTCEMLRGPYGDWKETFKYAVDFTRHDVESVIASVDGYKDGPHWVGLFRLKDGRVGYVTAWCDYTGWG